MVQLSSKSVQSFRRDAVTKVGRNCFISIDCKAFDFVPLCFNSSTWRPFRCSAEECKTVLRLLEINMAEKKWPLEDTEGR